MPEKPGSGGTSGEGLGNQREWTAGLAGIYQDGIYTETGSLAAPGRLPEFSGTVRYRMQFEARVGRAVLSLGGGLRGCTGVGEWSEGGRRHLPALSVFFWRKGCCRMGKMNWWRR